VKKRGFLGEFKQSEVVKKSAKRDSIFGGPGMFASPVYPPGQSHVLPSDLGNYYCEATGGTQPNQNGYVAAPGQFKLAQLQYAKQQLDPYYSTMQQRTHSYDVAECMIEGVTAHVTEAWLDQMGMDAAMRALYVPSCTNVTLPVSVPNNRRPYN